VTADFWYPQYEAGTPAGYHAARTKSLSY